MDIKKRLQLSYYKTIATLNEEHKIYIVQNSEDKHIYVKKILDVYNYNVYKYLHSHHVNGTPFIYELYQEENTLTVIEEYISGKTLEELLRQKHIFSIDEIKNIVWQLCNILNQLHNCKPAIIHRDLKPSNIILTDEGRVVLLDLNAAKHFSNNGNEDTTLLGTKGYAAPEQYGFGMSNPQTDIYALGMVINTLLHGDFSPIPYPNTELTPIVIKCLKLPSEKRYKSVNEIKKQLNVSLVDSSKLSYNKMMLLPPGFRHLKPLNMIVASIVYIFTFWLCLSLEVKNSTPVTLFIQRIFCLIGFLGVELISNNYLGVQKSFSLCRSNNIIVRILGICIFDFIYLFAIIVIMLILCTVYS